jgi:hypothetical protein
VTLPADRDAGPLASDLRGLSAELDVEIHLRPDDADVL